MWPKTESRTPNLESIARIMPNRETAYNRMNRGTSGVVNGGNGGGHSNYNRWPPQEGTHRGRDVDVDVDVPPSWSLAPCSVSVDDGSMENKEPLGSI